MDADARALQPFFYPKMQGVELTTSLLDQIKKGRRFKVNLYPNALKPWPRGKDVWRCMPQPNEIYYFVSITDPYGIKITFNGPLRERGTGTYNVCGSFRTQWYIDMSDLCLYTKKTGLLQDKFVKYTPDEFRIIPEPYDRCWNQPCVDFIVSSRDPRFSRSMNPTQFAHLLRLSNDDKLLQRKRQNQKRRSMRSRTPSPTYKRYGRKYILAKTALQRTWNKAELLNPSNRMIFMKVGNMFTVFKDRAIKMAKFTDLKLTTAAPWPTVSFSEDKVDHYISCCHQKGWSVKQI